MGNETEAKTLVEMIRAQRSGVLLVDEADAVRLFATALRVAEDRGVIAGMERMSAIIDKALEPALAVAS